MPDRSKRPSPPYPAKEHKGEKHLGNDRNWYVSLPDKNLVYHWKKYSPVLSSATLKTAQVYFRKLLGAKSRNTLILEARKYDIAGYGMSNIKLINAIMTARFGYKINVPRLSVK